MCLNAHARWNENEQGDFGINKYERQMTYPKNLVNLKLTYSI